MPTPSSFRLYHLTTSSSASPNDPRHAISLLLCSRSHLFSFSFSLIRRSPLCRDLLSTSARRRLFPPFRPRALCCCIISPTSVVAPSTPLPRRFLGSSLGYRTIICVYGEDGCFREIPRQARSNRKTIPAICNLSRMRDVTAMGYELAKRSILETDRTTPGVKQGNSRSNPSRRDSLAV